MSTKNKRIIRFITYYRSLPVKKEGKKVRGEIKRLISETCEFVGGTFNYKLTNKNYSELELTAIEKIIKDYQDGKIEML